MAAFSTHKYAVCILFMVITVLNQFGHIDAYTMEETCLYYKEGYIGDPSNCQAWGYCKGGSVVKRGLCGSGLLYDSVNGMCNYKNLVTCASTITNVCANAVDPGYYADPNNCNAYAYCSNGKVQQSFNCAASTSFNPNTKKCVWNSSFTCSANSICRLVSNNKFVGDPSKCGNYIRCVNGAGPSLQCNDNILFNPLEGGCDPNYSCNAPSVPEETTMPANVNATMCNDYNKYTANKDGVVYIPDGSTCYGFYGCTSTTTPGTWGSCAFATHFDPKSQSCVTPYAYNCPIQYNRCGNLNWPFVALPGCAGYIICSNGQSVGTGNCKQDNPNFPWFNEAQGFCVQGETAPDQAICAAPAPGSKN